MASISSTNQNQKKDNLLLTLYVMHLGLLAKLTIFDRICNLNFSLENLKTKEKDYVRSRTSEWNIFRFVLPRVVKYNYESIDVIRDSKKIGIKIGMPSLEAIASRACLKMLSLKAMASISSTTKNKMKHLFTFILQEGKDLKNSNN